MGEKQKVESDKSEKKKSVKKRKPKKQSVNEKNATLQANNKWINYSEVFLGQKFRTHVNLPLSHEQQSIPKESKNDSIPPPSSPKDVNEISLHISLLDTCINTTSDSNNIYYICAGNQI